MYHLEPQVTIPKPESTLKKTIKRVSKFYSTSKSMRGKRGTLRRVKGQWGALSEEDDLEFFKTSNVTSACLLYHTSMTMINLDQFQHCSLASVCKSGIHVHCICPFIQYNTMYMIATCANTDQRTEQYCNWSRFIIIKCRPMYLTCLHFAYM